jgi:hypothetical protein
VNKARLLPNTSIGRFIKVVQRNNKNLEVSENVGKESDLLDGGVFDGKPTNWRDGSVAKESWDNCASAHSPIQM